MQIKGEKLKNAIKWVSEMKQSNPEKSIVVLTDEANIRFDLNPQESEFVINFFKNEDNSK